MPLTDVAIRKAKPREKPCKIDDTLDLFLLVQPRGGKPWRVKYRIDGGVFPSIGSLKRLMSDNTINAGLHRMG